MKAGRLPHSMAGFVTILSGLHKCRRLILRGTEWNAAKNASLTAPVSEGIDQYFFAHWSYISGKWLTFYTIPKVKSFSSFFTHGAYESFINDVIEASISACCWSPTMRWTWSCYQLTNRISFANGSSEKSRILISQLIRRPNTSWFDWRWLRWC